MGLDYDRIKRRSDHGSFWTSYADLFLMLSTVFLLLYVVATLRSGQFGIEKTQQYQKIRHEADDLKEQIRVYNALRDEQVAKSSESEQQVYNNLMDKLSLLKEQAKEEKEVLRRKATENERKEEALNQYQQIIRNIINANVLAKGQIKRREAIIQNDESVIEKQTAEIEGKERAIKENSVKIATIESELARKIQRLREQEKKAHISSAAARRQVASLRKESEQRIETLKAESERERFALKEELNQARDGYQVQISALKAEDEKRRGAERAAFEKEMSALRLSADSRAAKEAEFRKKAEGQARELAGKIAGIEAQAQDAERRYEQASAEKGRALAAVQGLKQENAEISKDLKHAKEIADAKKNLARAIRDNFRKAGIKADVNAGTGDVTLAFPDDYFDAGQANLKPGMENRLKKFIPAYTRSLFSDPKTADKIENVEIIGYASPTYKGKYVNPQSLKESDHEAVDYNLRLSFSRANSIFKYIFDKKQLTYAHQASLLPMVKVVGRGYLPENKSGDEIPDGLSEKDFCKRYDCKRAQKVVIKFNLKD